MSLPLILLFLAILWALTAKAPRPLRTYFSAQLFNTILVAISYGYLTSSVYVVLYAIGLGAIAYAMAEIVWDNQRQWSSLFFASALCVIFTMAACFGVKKFDAGAWAGLMEGGILTFCGSALALSVPRSEHPKIPAALVCLWLVLAFFDYAYAMQISGTELLNLWFRTFAVIAAMVYLGMKLREPATQ